MYDSNKNSRPDADLARREMALTEPAFAEGAPAVVLWLGLLFSVLGVGLFLFFNTQQFVSQFQTKFAVESEDSAKIRRYNLQLASLQERMTAFIADSVENRLRSLEKNIQAGEVGTQDIRNFEELRNELKLLESYAAGNGGNLTDSSRLEHPRFQVTPGTKDVGANRDMIAELVQLKTLLYISIASCGVVAFMVGGYWWQSSAKVKRLQSAPVHRPLLLRRQDSGDI